LSKGYIYFQEALKLISENVNQKVDTRYEAKAILKQLSKLETVLLADFWAVILERFNQVSKSLQHETLELQSAIKLLTSLLEFLMSLRNQFEVFENKAKNKVENTEYHDEQKREHMRRKQINDGNAEDGALRGSQKFKVETYLPIIDKLCSALSHRIEAYNIKMFIHCLVSWSNFQQ